MNRFIIQVTNSYIDDKCALSISKKIRNSSLLSFVSNVNNNQTTVKNERKYIEIVLDKSHKDKSLIYKSDISINSSDVFPSLIASLDSTLDANTPLKIKLYYSSSLTRGQDIILSHFICQLKDLLSMPSSGMTTLMASEYPIEVRLTIRLWTEFNPVFTYSPSSLGLVALDSTNNPLIQKYFFYQSTTSHSSTQNASPRLPPTPTLDALEYCYEPKFAFKLSLLFLESILNEFINAHRAWCIRRHMESMRRGHFASPESASHCGWSQVYIEVISAKLIISKPHTSNNKANANTTPMKGASTKPYTYYIPLYTTSDNLPYLSKPNTEPAYDTLTSALDTRTTAAVSKKVSHSNSSSSNYLSKLIEASTSLKTAVTTASQIPTTAPTPAPTAAPPTGKPTKLDRSPSKSKPKRRVDESLPSTYVDIYIIDRYVYNVLYYSANTHIYHRPDTL